jgi:hypothetical protein
MKDDPASELRALINEEDSRMRTSFNGDGRWALLELVRSIDAYFYHVLSLRGEENEEEKANERHYLNVYGANRALSLFLSEAASGYPVPLYPSIPEAQAWADSLVQHCGRLSSCEVGLQMARYGLASLSRQNSALRIAVSKGAGIESVEREQFQYIDKVVREMDQDAWHEMVGRRDDIIERMMAHVYPWRERYIGYTTMPEFDSFYEGLGVLWARRFVGLDAFPGEAMFGGQPFHLYRATLASLAGWTLKHIDFCQALQRKKADVVLRNVLTIFQERELMAEAMSDCLQVPLPVAEQALAAFVLTPANKELHCATPGGYTTPLIQIGDGSIVTSVAGVLVEPVQFMLAELKRRYPTDWDRAVGLREEQFRNELYNLFPEPEITKVRSATRLRSSYGKTATDVDAAVFDHRAGSLGLFQLKWQDPFGASLRRRESAKRNFQSARDWATSVTEWLGTRSPEELARQFRLRTNGGRGVEKVHLFVIGRNFAHFSGTGSTDVRAAWGMWPQVVRLAVEKRNKSDPVEGLFEALQADSLDVQARELARELEPMELLIRDTIVRLEYGSGDG